MRERLASRHPERYEADLALSLNNLSNRLAESGRGEEALSAIERAVEILERVVAKPCNPRYGQLLQVARERLAGGG